MRRYLGPVDRLHDQNIYAFVTPGNITFLLQYDGRSEDGVRGFFSEVSNDVAYKDWLP